MSMRRRGLTVVGIAVVLAVSGTASASATGQPSSQGTAKKGWTCPTARWRLTTLANHVKPHFQEKIARVEAVIASGNLSRAQMRHQQRFLANLHSRIDKIDAWMATLAAKIASCGQQS